MALLAGAAAAVLAAVPVAAVGIMNALKQDDNPEPAMRKIPTLGGAPPLPIPTHLTQKQYARAQPQDRSAQAPPGAASREPYSVLNDPAIFPKGLSGPETRATDLYRDPYTQQLYLCTENDLPGANTDYDLHPSDLASARNLDVLNGRVGNEFIERRGQLNNGRDCEG